MNLIDVAKELAELEPKVHYPYLVYVLPDMKTSAAGKTDADAKFIHDMRMSAPAMLAVLGCFRPGDAATLDPLIEEERLGILDECFGERTEVLDLFERLQKAAQLMEATE